MSIDRRKKDESGTGMSAADRFKGFKGISSDQYFGRDQVRDNRVIDG